MRSILVVDDDVDLCWIVSKVLAGSGYAVQVAHTGEQALRMAGPEAPDLAILDYRLPDADGIGLLGRLRARQPGLKAFLVTSYPTTSMRADAIEAGFQGFLLKPLQMTGLLGRVRDILDPACPSGPVHRATDPAALPPVDRTLLASALHDLGNPLHAAISSVQYLAEELERTGRSQYELARIVLVALRRMDRVLRGFGATRWVDRLEPGGPVDLNRVVRETAGLMKAECDRRRIELSLELGATLPDVQCHADGLSDVLLNLLVNSLEAMDDGGRLALETSRMSNGDATRVLFTVTDSGPGLPPELMSEIGSPFVSSKGPGRGLGLFLCSQIVRSYGGTFEIRDAGTRGTRATITLRPSGEVPR